MTFLQEIFSKIIIIENKDHLQIITTVLLVVIFWLIYKFLFKFIFKRIHNLHSRYRFKKISVYFLFFLGFFFLFKIWFEGFKSPATFLGIFSAGIAIALKDVLVDIAAWVFIIFKRPFEVGDRIQIGEHKGDVIDARVFEFTILEVGNWVDAEQSTGRIIHVPNSKVFSEALANYSKGFHYIWNEIPVLLTFESNWQNAKKILEKIIVKHTASVTKEAEKGVKEAAHKFMIKYTKLTPIIYTSVKDSGILLTLRHLCDPRERRGQLHLVWENILTEFAKHQDIDFAYPTTRFYNDFTEGNTKNARKN